MLQLLDRTADSCIFKIWDHSVNISYNLFVHDLQLLEGVS